MRSNSDERAKVVADLERMDKLIDANDNQFKMIKEVRYILGRHCWTEAIQELREMMAILGKYRRLTGHDEGHNDAAFNQIAGKMSAVHVLENENEKLREELDCLRDAATNLYEAGTWTMLPIKMSQLSDESQAAYWEDLRDALGREPSTADVPSGSVPIPKSHKFVYGMHDGKLQWIPSSVILDWVSQPQAEEE